MRTAKPAARTKARRARRKPSTSKNRFLASSKSHRNSRTVPLSTLTVLATLLPLKDVRLEVRHLPKGTQTRTAEGDRQHRRRPNLADDHDLPGLLQTYPRLPSVPRPAQATTKIKSPTRWRTQRNNL